MEDGKESKKMMDAEDEKVVAHTRKKMGILHNAFASLDILEAMVNEETEDQKPGSFTSAEDAQAFLKEYLDRNK